MAVEHNNQTRQFKKIPAESRFCPICKSDNAEDEIHFLSECPAFSVERNVFFHSISKMCKNFTSMSNFRKCIWLLSNENANVLRCLLSLYTTEHY